MNTLLVPHVSQITEGALSHNNDCGAACTMMIIKAYGLGKEMSVDNLYNELNPSGDVALSAGTLQTFLAKYGIKNTWAINLTLTSLFESLSAGRPSIALVNYAPLVDAGLTEKSTFRGAHFIVVVGIDIQYVYVQDPYTITKGILLPVPHDVFRKMWAQCVVDGNPVGGAITMNFAIKDLSVPIEDPLAKTPGKYTFGKDATGRDVLAVYVRAGAGQTYSTLGVLTKAAYPTITIDKVSNGYGRLSDTKFAGGWVYIDYFIKV